MSFLSFLPPSYIVLDDLLDSDSADSPSDEVGAVDMPDAPQEIEGSDLKKFPLKALIVPPTTFNAGHYRVIIWPVIARVSVNAEVLHLLFPLQLNLIFSIARLIHHREYDAPSQSRSP